jgi:hypothetical protein
MTDDEAIEIAKRYGGKNGPIVKIPPMGAVDEITTVDLRNWDRPVVTRDPSEKFMPGYTQYTGYRP